MVLPTNWILSGDTPSFRRFRSRSLRHEEQIRNMIGKNAITSSGIEPVEGTQSRFYMGDHASGAI